MPKKPPKEPFQQPAGQDPPVRILYLENNPMDFELVQSHFETAQFNAILRRAETREEFLEGLAGFDPDIILLDAHLPLFHGKEALNLLNEQKIGLPVVLYTGSVGEEQAVEYLKLGADDFVTKQNPGRLVSAIISAIEKRKTIEAFREKSEELDRYFEHSLDLLCIADTDGYFRRLNREWKKTLGYKISDLEGKKFMDFVHPDDLPSTLEAIATLSSQKAVLNFINRYRCKDGSYKWIEWNSYPEGKTIFAVARDITEKVRVENLLRSLSYRQEAILAAVPDIIMEVDNNKVYTWANKAGFDFFGEDVIGKEAVFYFEGEQDTYRVVQPIFNGAEDIFFVESWQRRKDGQRRLLAWWCRVLKDENGTVTGALSSAKDITEHKQSEEKILKLNRIYTVISQINQAIVRTREKDKLFAEVCRIAIEYGKFRMAWIGLVNEEEKVVKPISFDGVEESYLSRIKKISISDVPEGRGSTDTAIREGRYFICNDIENDQRMAPWKDEAIKRGYRSSIALPLKMFGKVIGAFSLYSEAPNFFDQQEIDLLDEVTNDISFALETIETEKKRQEAEEALKESESMLRSFFDSQGVMRGIIEVVAEDDVRHIADNAVTAFFLGLTPEAMKNKLGSELGEPREILRTWISFYKQSQRDNKPVSFEYLDKRGGNNAWLSATVSYLGTYQNGDPRFGYVVSDITERVQTLEALRESEAHYRALADSITDVFFEMNQDLHYTYWNKASEALTGIPVQAAIGKSMHELFPDTPEIRKAEGLYLHVLRTQQPTTFENAYQIADKRYIFEISVYPSTHGISVFTKDITERKQAEEALINSESKFHAIIEASPVPFALNDKMQNIIYLNTAFVKTFGYTLDSIPTLTDWWPRAYPDPEYRQWVATTWQAKLEKTMQTGTPFEPMELNIRCKDNMQRTAMVSAVPLGESFSNVHLVILYDITERKKAEEALRENEKRFRALLENSYDAITLLAADGTVLYDFPSMTRVLGYDTIERIGRKVFEFVPPEDRESMEQGFVKFARQMGAVTPSVVRFIHKDGTLRWIEGVRTNLLHVSSVGAIVVNYRDITERKNAEETIRLQLKELRQWYETTLGREDRIRQLKHEVNQLHQRLGEPVRYPSQETGQSAPSNDSPGQSQNEQDNLSQ